MLADRYELDAAIDRAPSLLPGRDHLLAAPVSVLVLPAPSALLPRLEAIHRLRLFAKVRHPGLAEIRAVGEHDDLLYAALQPLHGDVLHDLLLLRRPPPAGLVHQMAVALLGALAALHQAGFVHGDVDPGAVLLATQDSVEGLAITLLPASLTPGAHLASPSGPELRSRESRTAADDVRAAAGLVLAASRKAARHSPDAALDAAMIHVLERVTSGGPSESGADAATLRQTLLDAAVPPPAPARTAPVSARQQSEGPTAVAVTGAGSARSRDEDQPLARTPPPAAPARGGSRQLSPPSARASKSEDGPSSLSRRGARNRAILAAAAVAAATIGYTAIRQSSDANGSSTLGQEAVAALDTGPAALPPSTVTSPGPAGLGPADGAAAPGSADAVNDQLQQGAATAPPPAGVSPGSGSLSAGTVGPAPVGPGALAPPPTAPEAALAACAQAVRVAEAVVAAEVSGAQNWRVHTSAWLDLIDGKISKAKADADWQRSRDAGPSDLAGFQRAYQPYQTTPVHCGDVVQQAGPAQVAAAQACADRGAAADAAVASGRVVLDQWGAHVEQMGQSRTHELPPEEARTMFRAAVARSAGDLSSYQRDVDRLSAAPACPAT